MQQPKKVVSKAQYRFFRDALRCVEAGGKSLIKDMTPDELRFALVGVDYNALPERVGQAAGKPRPQPQLQAPARPAPPPPPPPDGVLSLDAYRARHPEKASPPADEGEPARILSFEGYLRRHPGKKRRGLSSKTGHEWFAGLFR
jgi:hypothetical protein